MLFERIGSVTLGFILFCVESVRASERNILESIRGLFMLATVGL